MERPEGKPEEWALNLGPPAPAIEGGPVVSNASGGTGHETTVTPKNDKTWTAKKNMRDETGAPQIRKIRQPNQEKMKSPSVIVAYYQKENKTQRGKEKKQKKKRKKKKKKNKKKKQKKKNMSTSKTSGEQLISKKSNGCGETRGRKSISRRLKRDHE